MRISSDRKKDGGTGGRYCPPQETTVDPSRSLPIDRGPTVPEQDRDTMANRLTGRLAVVKERRAIFPKKTGCARSAVTPLPRYITMARIGVGNAGQHEQQVGQPVEIDDQQADF